MALTQLRKSAGLSQRQLAAKAGINLATLSYMENGYQPPRSKAREAVARALGVPESSLFNNNRKSGP